MSTADIVHHHDTHRFTLAIDGAEAVLEYHLTDAAAGDERSTVIDFTRTFVPPEFRGKGFAEALVREGLAWAKQQGYHITASCWYVERFLR